MKISTQLKAVFFMLILVMAMLHDALPHSHYEQHEDHAVRTSSDHHHGHQHPHHHADQDETEPDQTGSLFDFLLGEHAYLIHAHQFKLYQSHQDKVLSPKKVPVGIIEGFWSISRLETEHLHRFSYFRSSTYCNPFLLTNNLRAPPISG